ncbi:hypothetical protein [Saccharibacillus alkalitolerans]|nr:hypothetical protein [Saccharibacillus alkalitolerans]
MMAGLKEFKSWISGTRQMEVAWGEEDYRKLEFSAARHLHTPEVRSPITYEEEARMKMVQYH